MNGSELRQVTQLVPGQRTNLGHYTSLRDVPQP